MTNWREQIEAQIAEATEHGDPLDMVYIEVHAPVLQALLDDRKRLRAALERIDIMACNAEMIEIVRVAREALQDGE